MRVKTLIGALAVVGVTVLLAAGCSSGASTSSGGSSNSKKPDSLTIAVPDAGTSIDPNAALGLTSDSIVLATYDTLVEYHVENGAMVPGKYDPSIAKSWDTSSDGLTWTFHLRDDIKFQSGDPLTSADVKYSFDRMKGTTYYNLGKLASIDATDPTTVTIHLTVANPGLLDYIGMYSMSIIDSKLMAKQGDTTTANTWIATNTAGSGPYKLVSRDDSQVIFKANPDYFGKKPAIQNVIMKIVPDLTTEIQQLEKNDVQMMKNVPVQNIDQLKKTKDVKVIEEDAGNTAWLSMNETSSSAPEFSNVLVRQALADATPYDDIVKNVLQGHGKRLLSPMPSVMPGFYDAYSGLYKTDTAKAKSLLAKAGYPKGFSFNTLVSSSNAQGLAAATILQDAYKQIGVTMNVQTVTAQQYSDQRASADSIIGSWLSFINQPRYHLGFLLYSTGSANYSHYKNPTVDALMDKAQYETGDAANADWKTVQTDIAQDVPWVLLYQASATTATNSSVAGYSEYIDDLIRIKALHYK